ncbi:hypothetical protein COOONC_15745, partial [Cooperia oncophora]
MLDNACMTNIRPNSNGWKIARAFLAGDITLEVAGSPVQLNPDQVSAVNMFNKRYPINIVDSAFGAVTAVQNGALDIIGEKIAELQSPDIRAIRRVGNSWIRILIDEASMVPEAALMTLISRFQDAHITLIGDLYQLPPYVGISNCPLAREVSYRSVLDIGENHRRIPSCALRTVYRPHVEMLKLSSEFFYNREL